MTKAVLFKNGKAHTVTVEKICSDRTWLTDSPQRWANNKDLMTPSPAIDKLMVQAEHFATVIAAHQKALDEILTAAHKTSPFPPLE